MQLIMRLKFSLNFKNFTSLLKECVFKCHLNTVVHQTFSFNISVSLYGKLLNILMPAYYVIFWKDENLAIGLCRWHISHVYNWIFWNFSGCWQWSLLIKICIHYNLFNKSLPKLLGSELNIILKMLFCRGYIGLL